MAVAELTPLILTRNDGTALTTAYQAVIDSATGAYIDWFDTAQNNQQGRLVLIAGSDSDQNTGGKTLIVKTSTNSPFTGSGQSNLEDDMSTEDASFIGTLDGSISVYGPLETARYVDTDGYINIEISTADTAGNVYLTALVVP